MTRATIVALAAVTLAACGSDAKTKTVTVTRTVEAPAEATPEPAEETEPASRPTSREVVAALLAAKLEAASPAPIAKADFGVAPHTTTDGTYFLVPSVCADCGGRAWTYDTVAKLRGAKAAYDALGAQGDPLFSWTFANEDALVLLQLNGDAPPALAQRYGRAIAAL